MAEVIFIVNPPGWKYEFQSWEGTVGKHIAELTLRTRTAAVVQAPKPGTPPINRSGLNYATGYLASHITSSHGYWTSASGRELEGTVSSEAPHSLYVTQGTTPHRIFPSTPGGRLVFFWARAGRVVGLPHVRHPGTMANDFLNRALEMSVV